MASSRYRNYKTYKFTCADKYGTIKIFSASAESLALAKCKIRNELKILRVLFDLDLDTLKHIKT